MTAWANYSYTEGSDTLPARASDVKGRSRDSHQLALSVEDHPRGSGERLLGH